MILRKGMWVTFSHDGKKTGIVDGFTNNEVIVHLVDESGDTVMALGLPVGALSQATLEDIPEPRRPSIEVAKHYGYA